MSAALEAWIESELRYAVPAMLRSVSPVELVKQRPGFGQTIRARAGAIIASPVLAAYDPDPDYFFHWFRDSAVVIDALRLLHEDGRLGDEVPTMLGDFAEFSLQLNALDAQPLVDDARWRAPVIDDYQRYLRDDAELTQVRGTAVAAEARVNADGTLDISKWARPQHDGPPLRALAVLRWLRSGRVDAARTGLLESLLRFDLAFTAARGGAPSFDIWEEELGLHYYNLRVSADALARGADWLAGQGEMALATQYRVQSVQLLLQLDGFWREPEAYLRSRIIKGVERSPKELDIAVIFAAIHIDAGQGAHSVADPRLQATLAQLEALFDGAYQINHQRAAGTSPAMGRYLGDVYYSGGAYYFSTFAAAEFCFRAAVVSDAPASWLARGDGYLQTIRAHTPASGELSEQFDQDDGRQTSAKHLAWSYAALISCVAARRRAMARGA